MHGRLQVITFIFLILSCNESQNVKENGIKVTLTNQKYDVNVHQLIEQMGIVLVGEKDSFNIANGFKKFCIENNSEDTIGIRILDKYLFSSATYYQYGEGLSLYSEGWTPGKLSFIFPSEQLVVGIKLPNFEFDSVIYNLNFYTSDDKFRKPHIVNFKVNMNRLKAEGKIESILFLNLFH